MQDKIILAKYILWYSGILFIAILKFDHFFCLNNAS